MDMSVLIRILLLAAVSRGILGAQPSNGYVFFAPGGVTCCSQTAMTLQFGAGGEYVVGKGVGVGAEIGAVGARQYFGDTLLGVFSPNGYYHFVHDKEVKTDPFVTAGYTLMFRNGHANLFNFGAGLNYWFHTRLGARMEFRDQLHTANGSSLHYWGGRFGFTFR
jgi:hypothetical protein